MRPESPEVFPNGLKQKWEKFISYRNSKNRKNFSIFFPINFCIWHGERSREKCYSRHFGALFFHSEPIQSCWVMPSMSYAPWCTWRSITLVIQSIILAKLWQEWVRKWLLTPKKWWQKFESVISFLFWSPVWVSDVALWYIEWLRLSIGCASYFLPFIFVTEEATKVPEVKFSMWQESCLIFKKL